MSFETLIDRQVSSNIYSSLLGEWSEPLPFNSDALLFNLFFRITCLIVIFKVLRHLIIQVVFQVEAHVSQLAPVFLLYRVDLHLQDPIILILARSEVSIRYLFEELGRLELVCLQSVGIILLLQGA